MRGGDLARSAIPRSDRDAHSRVRGEFGGRLVRGELQGVRCRPSQKEGRGCGYAASGDVQEAGAELSRSGSRDPTSSRGTRAGVLPLAARGTRHPSRRPASHRPGARANECVQDQDVAGRHELPAREPQARAERPPARVAVLNKLGYCLSFMFGSKGSPAAFLASNSLIHSSRRTNLSAVVGCDDANLIDPGLSAAI